VNNPEIWLIPLIMIIVWIVSSFARSGDNDKSKNRQQRTVRGERPATEKTWQRPSSEIDRFLEEVNRRRRQAGDRRPTAEEPPRPLPASLSRSQQATAPRQAPSPPRSTDRGKSANKRPASPAPSAKAPGPTAAALRVSEIEAINVPEVLPVAAASAPPPSADAFPATGQMEQPAAAGSAGAGQFPGQLVALLQGPQSLATAVILQEIFGRPRCRRRTVRTR